MYFCENKFFIIIIIIIIVTFKKFVASFIPKLKILGKHFLHTTNLIYRIVIFNFVI